MFMINLKGCKRNLEMTPFRELETSKLWRFLAQVACFPALRRDALTHLVSQFATSITYI